ncbi:MAG: hypothetical protein H6739_42375 [Alphaproteobacteria bacterium]|nr:hypothetical protein [Alphaproteobacteria bacterium]
MRAERSPSASLLRLCLLGLSATPAVAGPLEELGDGALAPECGSIRPSSAVTIGPPVLSDWPGTVAPSDLDVADDLSLWAVGPGGSTWRRPSPRTPWTELPGAGEADLHAVAALGSFGAWVVGDAGALLRWQEDSWVKRRSPGPRSTDLLDVDFLGQEWGVIGGAGGALYVTTNGGAKWKRLGRASEADVTVVEVASTQMVVAGRADGTVLAATWDGPGTRWVEREMSVTDGAGLRDLHALSQLYMVAVDDAGGVWSTQNGGKRWAPPLQGQAEDPVRSIVEIGREALAVHASGAVTSVAFTPDGARLVPIGVMPSIGPVEPVEVLRAVSGSDLVVAVTADGRLLSQGAFVWDEPGHPCGRPFEVQGRAALAAVREGDGWNTDGIDLTEDLPSASRAALAAAWLQDARAEHASVASFARFSLRLLALGAPSALVEDAQVAMGDEIRHARACFGLASRYAGVPLAAGPLPMAGAMAGGGDLAAVAVEVLREGAVGETLGALLAEEMRQRATDPQARAALEMIAADEARHAQMAWRFLRWAVDQGGEDLRARLAEAAEAALAEQLAVADALTGDTVPVGWAAHGRLRPSAQRRVSRRALHRVVKPCLDALLTRA